MLLNSASKAERKLVGGRCGRSRKDEVVKQTLHRTVLSIVKCASLHIVYPSHCSHCLIETGRNLVITKPWPADPSSLSTTTTDWESALCRCESTRSELLRAQFEYFSFSFPSYFFFN